MACAPDNPALSQARRDPAVRAIVHDWRALTGGKRVCDAARRTLVACSGGADSSALAIALASASEQVVLGHVVHDLRAREVALADRDAAASLAGRLNVPFVSSEIATAGSPGNREGVARSLRYESLQEMADDGQCRFIATAHHADDQAETVLMRLIRGSGPRGLSGIAPRRGRIIRPMLGATREDAERVCAAFGWAWSIDETNADLSRFRASIRHQVMPVLRRLAPTLPMRVRSASLLLAEAADLVEGRARAVLDGMDAPGAMLRLPRDALREEPGIVIGQVLREVVRRHAGRGDGLPERVLRAIAAYIRSDATEPGEFFAGGLRVEVDAREVRCSIVVCGPSEARPGSAPRRTSR